MEAFQVNDKKNAVIEFFYENKKNKAGLETLNVYDPDDKEVPQKAKKGKVYIRYPNWSVINDVSRESGVINPFSRKLEINPYKYRDVKLKRLVYRIEDADGNSDPVDDEYINKMPVQLAMFISRKIESLVATDQEEDGLTEDEKKELEIQCFFYYSKIKKHQAGVAGIIIPSPPSIIVIKQICEMFGCTPDVARRISRRDIDMLQVASKVEENCNDPDLIGLTDRSKLGGESSGRAKLRR